LSGAQLLNTLALPPVLTRGVDVEGVGVLAQAATVKARQKTIGSLFMNLTSSLKGYAPTGTFASLVG
jgi:hypothetical protein